MTLRDPAYYEAVHAVSLTDDAASSAEFDRLVIRYGWEAANRVWQQACDDYDRTHGAS